MYFSRPIPPNPVLNLFPPANPPHIFLKGQIKPMITRTRALLILLPQKKH